MAQQKRLWTVVIAVVATTLLLGVALVIALVLREPEADDQVEWLEEGVAHEGPARIYAANDELLVIGRRVGSSKSPPHSLIAIDAIRTQRWQAQNLQRPRAISDRWLQDRGGKLVDLRSGSVVPLPAAGNGPVMDLGDVLVHASEAHALRAFDGERPTDVLWRIPGEFGWYTDGYRFEDRIGLFDHRNGVFIGADGPGEPFRLPGTAVGADDDAVFVQTADALVRVSLETKEQISSLAGVATGLTSLGGFGELTLWQESGFDEREEQWADAAIQSRIFAWHPDEPAVRWETSTPHGAVLASYIRPYSEWYLPDVRAPLPGHACWPINGERTNPMSSQRFVRVVCLDLSDGTITHRGNAGLRDVDARHDAEGTTLSIDEMASVTLVRLTDQPVRALMVPGSEAALTARHVWLFREGPDVHRLSASLEGAPAHAQELPLSAVLSEPNP